MQKRIRRHAGEAWLDSFRGLLYLWAKSHDPGSLWNTNIAGGRGGDEDENSWGCQYMGDNTSILPPCVWGVSYWPQDPS